MPIEKKIDPNPNENSGSGTKKYYWEEDFILYGGIALGVVEGIVILLGIGFLIFVIYWYATKP